MKKNIIIKTLLLIAVNNSLNADFIDWVKSPWTWAGLALSGATIKLGYWAYLSKKQEAVAAQIDRARSNLKLEKEEVPQTLHALRAELSAGQLISQETECIDIMRRIGYPQGTQFASDLELINKTPLRSKLNEPRVQAVENHLRHVLGDPAKNKAGASPYVPQPVKQHKQQVQTLALCTTTLACAIGAAGCFAHGMQR